MTATREAELTAAILADPVADAPRAELAALLGGGPRGDFIRLQLAASAALRAERPYEDDLRRAAKLLRAHGADWDAAVRPLVDETTFIRGFVDQVRLDARGFLDRAGAIFAAAPVIHVHLGGVRGLEAELAASPHLARLRSLGLARSGIDDAGVAALVASPHLGALRWLDLSYNALDVPAYEALCAARLPGLAYVGLHGNRAPDPCDAPTVEYDGPPRWAPQDATLQAALEARHGRRAWMHRYASDPRYFPPKEDQLL